MKERQRWKSEEDAVLRAYVKQYGPREWNLVSQRMNVSLDRDAKSCLERWKNYLKPGIKKGSLTDEEQRLVIRLQAKHGNKWKKIAAEVPGRTPKRLGKWWEVFKEKQQREELKESSRGASSPSSIDPGKYDRILENFAEKLLPPWLSNSHNNNIPSVALKLSNSAVLPAAVVPSVELGECCREVQEGYQAWAAQKKEAAWRLKRVELQLESEKACKRREKMEEMESKVRALEEEERVELERIDAEYREQVGELRRGAEATEQKLAQQWAAKHVRMNKFMELLSCHHVR